MIETNEQCQQAIIAILVGGYEMEFFIFGELSERDFQSIGYREMFSSCKALFDAGQEIDIVTMNMELSKRGKAVSILDGGDLQTPSNGTLRGVKQYIKRLRDDTAKKELTRIGTQLSVRAIDDSMDVEELVQITRGELDAVALDSVGGDHMSTIADIMPRVIAEIRRAEERTDIDLSTGFPDLDAKIPGWSPGQLYILAARPGMGKTALMLEHVRYAAAHGHHVAVFSLEMPEEQLAARYITQKTGIPTTRLLSPGKKDAAEWKRIVAASDDYSKLSIHIDDTPQTTLGQVLARSQKIATEHGLGLICIDYLQYLKSGEKHGSREEEVSAISRGLKAIAKRLSIPILCLSQLNRKCDERTNSRPVLSDLRESGAIEQDADVIMFIYRDSMYNKASDDTEAELIIAKNRHGATGKVDLRWDGQSMMFRSVEKRRKQPEMQDIPSHWMD